MSSAAFNPENALERKLVRATEGKLAFGRLWKALMKSKLYIPSRTDTIPEEGFEPLVYTRDIGVLMSVFTERNRVAPHASDFPFCLEMEGKEIIERMPRRLGIVVNPGWTAGFEIPPEGIQKLRGSR